MGHNRNVARHQDGDAAVIPLASVVVAPDAPLADAVDLARAAAVEDAGEELVGEHVGVLAEADRLVTHLFACLASGYRGWHWAVTVTRAPDGPATVNDVVLLPGDDALVAPPWVPWSERVQPGDLGAGDLLPTAPDDPRLVPGVGRVSDLTAAFTAEGDLEGAASLTPLGFGSWELGLGRERVLSPLGRDEAADRWLEVMGPDAAVAKAAPLTCTSCGFLMTIGGALGQVFGVCANVMSPADGRVVAMTFGCGAHSEVAIEEPEPIVGTALTVAEDDIVAVDLDAIPDPVEPAASVEAVEPVEAVELDVPVEPDEPDGPDIPAADQPA